MAERIMIVEDEYLIAFAMKKKLESWGYHVVFCESQGDSAISRLKEETIQLVLLDVLLENKTSGIDVARHIRSNNLPIDFIYVTASQDPDTLREIEDTKPVQILSKPYNDDILQNAIQTILGAKKSSRS